MNKKHDHDLILKMYFEQKLSLHRIAKTLDMHKSSVGYIVQSYKEGESYRLKQNERRALNRSYKSKYEDLDKLYNEKLNEIALLKKEVTTLKQKGTITLSKGI